MFRDKSECCLRFSELSRLLRSLRWAGGQAAMSRAVEATGDGVRIRVKTLRRRLRHLENLLQKIVMGNLLEGWFFPECVPRRWGHVV
jgi:hypothetical protein